jgi:hypothetical protein
MLWLSDPRLSLRSNLDGLQLANAFGVLLRKFGVEAEVTWSAGLEFEVEVDVT